MYDELWSGIAVVAAPGVEQAHELGHDGYALWIFALPLLLAAGLETPVTLLADRWSLRRVIASSLGALSVSLALCAAAHAPWLLSLALALAGATSGVACAAAQVALISERPEHAARALSRWTAGQAAGDSLAPLFVSAALWLGGDHRMALAAIAALVGVQALLAIRAPERTLHPDASIDEGDAPTEPLRATLNHAARMPRLWLYLLAASVCGLLDEVIVALATLRMHHDLGWSESLAAAAVAGISLGGLIGALVGERLLARISARAVLIACALLSAAALALFLIAHTVPLACAALFVLGAASATHHPLIMAAAYRLVPRRPGVVSALSNLLVPCDVLLPLAVGTLASRFGLGVALAALVLQPLVVFLTALDRRTG